MKKLVSILVCLVLLLAVVLALPQESRAATAQETGNAILENVLKQDGTFPATLPAGQSTYTAYCYVCKADKQWTPFNTILSGGSKSFPDGAHYYLPKDVTINGQLFLFEAASPKTMCLHTNGKTLTDTTYRMMLVAGGCTMNLMGGGAIHCNTKNNRGILYSNGACSINVYGTTLKNTATENNPTSGNAAVCLYSTSGVANLWGATLIGNDLSPVILTNGAVNLYNCTVTGLPAQVGNYAGQSDGNAALNLYDTTISGVDVQDGKGITVSGATKIGSLTLAAGKTVNPSALTAGASIGIAQKGTFTPAGMAQYAKYFTAAVSDCLINANGDGSLRCMPEGIMLVDAAGNETEVEDVLTAWATGSYEFVRIYGDNELALSGQDIAIDLAGSDLTVTGSGNIRLFDTANDGYDHTACGVLLKQGEAITVEETVCAPNGSTYVTMTDGSCVTAHRISIALNTVTLRTTSAGVYYKATYHCDPTVAKLVANYGVVVSLYNMPGSDFMTEPENGNFNAWTEAGVPFRSGVTATSGSVFGIFKDTRSAKTNDRYGRMKIYANAYIDLGNGPIVANVADAGKTADAEGFSGVAMSLYDVMKALDAAYSTYPNATRLQLDAFYAQWQEKGMGDWGFGKIGTSTGITGKIDNSDIDVKFAPGTTDAECPVCKKVVTWTAFVPSSDSQGLTGHYYLTEDVNFTGTNAAGIFYSSTKNTTLCFHLNGHNLTAPRTRAIFGSSGKLNVMGNGVVTGYNSAAVGSAVQTNNSVAGNTVRLYGGTYKRYTNSKGAVIGTQNCGEIYVYEGATLDAPGAMAVLQSAPGNARNSYVGLFGCTVNGDVVNKGSGSFASSLEIIDATVNGTVQTSESNVYVSGAAKISGIALEGEAKLQLGALESGASIGIANTGAFTERSDDAVAYAKFFRGTSAADSILVKDKTLYCGRDYLSDLQFAEGTTDAMCPVCGEVKTWTAVDGSAPITGEKVSVHYYLTQDIEFTAESGVLALFNPPHGTHTVCIHLNGHNFTGTNTRFIYGATCVTNVMGSGTVTGSRSDRYPYGSTVQINVASTAGTVNLYGGTWTQGESGAYSAEDYVISLSNNGSNINIYEDAKVVANSGGKAVYVGTSSMAASTMIIRGTVEGDVDVAAPSKTNATSLTLDGCDIQGAVTVGNNTNLTIAHAAKVQLLDIPESVQATLENMTQGAQVVVKNEGIFTQASSDAAAYANYFTAYNRGDQILVQGDQLRCKTDYTSKLYTDAEGKAYCPVCKEVKSWTAISSGEAKVAAVNGGHYYLANDIVYEVAYNGDTNVAFFSGVAARNSSTCLHLNGHDLTATATHAIFTGWGKLNVMGEGVVSGYGSGSVNAGAAVQVNNSVAGSGVYLYSGTYRSTADAKSQYVAAIAKVGGGLYIYEDADISSTTGKAIWVSSSGYRDSNLEVYGATVGGGIYTTTPESLKEDVNASAKLILKNATVDGTVDLAAGNSYTIEGLTRITKLQIAAGQTVDFVNLREGTAIGVSADGIFSGELEQADAWLQYLTCADAGDWIIVRDNAFYQGVKETIPTASESDQTALDTTYAGTTVRHGEMHNHTNSGPYRDDGTGNIYSTGADGKNSLTEWIAEMDRLKMDFAFIVDHGMSIHMYNENFRSDYFVGGTEPGTTITDSKANPKSPHYNMLFSDPAKLESIFFKWESKFKPIRWNLENFPTAQTPSEVGYRIKYPTFTTEEFGQLAKDVYAAGGLLVQVHPKYDSYIYSDDPMDYYFADYSGFEIITGSGGNMMYKDNNEAYETWVELLNMGKKIWATAGSDRHRLPDISGMTVMYTKEDKASEYMETVRQGNMAPGWVGIRMNVGTTAMGGETDFTGNRLQFSVGDIYNSGEKDYVNTPDPYVAGHTYRVELYDDGGILMTAYVDPTELSYFAIDCDETAMYYRVVVWDETDNERIGVSNPIWNTAYTAE